MKVLCFGSLNIDFTYRVRHFVKKGETLAADSLRIYSGGKGMNQSIALARAGASVWHAGAVGEDGLFLIKELEAAGVRTELIEIREEERTGNAIIQNDAAGDNCILLYGGANRTITMEQADRALSGFGPGDFLVLQNEVNGLPYLMEQAKEKGMQIAFNPSPMDEAVFACPLEAVGTFLLNEVEAAQLTGSTGGMEPEAMLAALSEKFPDAAVVLTLGEKGAYYQKGGTCMFQPAFPVKAVDTTAAGDTFTGYLIAGLTKGMPVKEAMSLAAKAASIAVTRPGAGPSIPKLEEI